MQHVWAYLAKEVNKKLSYRKRNVLSVVKTQIQYLQ